MSGWGRRLACWRGRVPGLGRVLRSALARWWRRLLGRTQLGRLARRQGRVLRLLLLPPLHLMFLLLLLLSQLLLLLPLLLLLGWWLAEPALRRTLRPGELCRAGLFLPH